MNTTFSYRIAFALIGFSILCGVLVLFLGYGGNPSPAAVIDAIPSEEASTAPTFDYIEIIDSCGPHYAGTCAVARAMPATSSPKVAQLRAGIVLQVASSTTEADGHTWYKIIFGDSIRYPERITDDWYVAADTVRHFTDTGEEEIIQGAATSSKKIVVDRSEQTLSAYNADGSLFMETPVSTGLDLTPTPLGVFTVYKKTPSRYMQGPLPGISEQYYDLPGVPWDLYFTAEGGAIHGAYWHDGFGTQWSHGCVNLPLDDARVLYYWAPVGTQVVVRD